MARVADSSSVVQQIESVNKEEKAIPLLISWVNKAGRREKPALTPPKKQERLPFD